MNINTSLYLHQSTTSNVPADDRHLVLQGICTVVGNQQDPRLVAITILQNIEEPAGVVVDVISKNQIIDTIKEL